MTGDAVTKDADTGAAAAGSVLVERRGRVAAVTLNRPPLNILDLATIAALRQRLDRLADDADLQVVTLRGAGDRAFSAGVAVEDHTPERIPAMLESFHGAVLALRRLPAVTVAVVRGHCLGGGMELASGCDMVLAADGSRFGQPEIDLGCFPPLAAALYPRLLGAAPTFDLLTTGRILTAEEAERLGFVSRRVPDADLEAAAERLVGELSAKSAAVLRLAKQAIRAGRERPFADALVESERIYLEELTRCDDMQEGLNAFLEKRRPEWRHG